jgi:hypothetical protein
MATNGVGLETLRSLVRGILNERDEVYAPDLAKELIANHGGADWWASLKDDVFDNAVYTEVVKVIGAQRRAGQKTVYGDRAITANKMVDRIEKMRTSRMGGMEWIGDRYKRISEMTKADVYSAAELRRERGDLHSRYAMFWETLARKMDDSQVVSDIASEEDLDALNELVTGKDD